MRNLDQAIKTYMEIRRNLPKDKKIFMNQFEGQKYFRFGNSWRRLSSNKQVEVVLYDEEDKLYFLTKT